jgi:hypothetical protein
VRVFDAFDILYQKTLVHPDTFRKCLGIYDFVKIKEASKIIVLSSSKDSDSVPINLLLFI